MDEERPFSKRLLKWFDEHGRTNLPWQKPIHPYRVWVSEIMLQQTQVATVIPYFERFMAAFPTVFELAKAPLDHVLHLWTGLGYYSRARNLHRAAEQIVREFHGQFPKTLSEWMSLPGVGRSTAGAVLSIAFRQPISILDGNVKRVLARFFGIDQPINERHTEALLWTLADHYIDPKRPHHSTQAIMDLGAMICTPKRPKCAVCPFQQDCEALLTDQTHRLPLKKALPEKPVRTVVFWMIRVRNSVLLHQRNEKGVWRDLYSFPETDGNMNRVHHQYLKEKKGMVQRFAQFRHTFSHYHLQIVPVCVRVPNRRAIPPFLSFEKDQKVIWHELSRKNSVGLPKPVVALLAELSRM